jgi:polysaccharide chain length determinant protein (PEP-CTERM system associated)
MLPGKRFTPEDVIQILRRRVWLLLLPLAIVAATTAVVARKLPDRFRSEALIVVVRQRVPESYVKSTVTTRIDDRLQSMMQQILSRTRLERIIQDFNLYPEERRTGIMEDIVDRMRNRDITAQIVQGDSFRVSYTGRDPRTVMKVTERLASLFIEENLRDRELQAENTDQFLESQLQDARKRLMEHEKKLEQYRKAYSGQLPSQLESNLQVIQNTQMQIQAVLESINRDREKRLLIERQLGEATAIPDAPASGDDGSPGTAAKQLATANAQLALLQRRLKADHPDIQQAKRVIRDLQKKADAEALEAPLSPDATRSKSPADVARDAKISNLRAELAQLDRQIASKQGEEQRLRGVASGYQQRVDVAPTRESEMTELNRDYATLQTVYTGLLAKKEDSKMAANMERRQGGEQFKLLDAARVPEKPVSPDRPMWNLFGLVGGLTVGLGLVALFEYRDGTLRTDDEVTSVLSLPVLAVVPLMRSDVERRRALRNRVIMGVGLGTAVAACLAVVVYTFVR